MYVFNPPEHHFNATCASPTQIYYTAYDVYYGSLSEAYAWEAFLSGDWFDFFYYQAKAAAFYEAAAEWWLTIKVDPFANHNVMLYGPNHSQLHNPDVWGQIKGDCGLRK